jgi:hypothetical protein
MDGIKIEDKDAPHSVRDNQASDRKGEGHCVMATISEVMSENEVGYAS